LIDDLLAPLFLKIVLKEEKKRADAYFTNALLRTHKNATNTIDSITPQKINGGEKKI
jgi:hypothetical protein